MFGNDMLCCYIHCINSKIKVGISKLIEQPQRKRNKIKNKIKKKKLYHRIFNHKGFSGIFLNCDAFSNIHAKLIAACKVKIGG